MKHNYVTEEHKKKGREFMKNNLKKLLCAALSAAVVAGTVVLPTVAGADGSAPIFEGDTVLKEWKFDFGAADSVPEDGYTLVSPDMNFTTNNEGEYQYGFLGTDPEDYNITDRYDGWSTQKGQVIELEAGGGTGLNDAVGVVGAGGEEDNKGKDIFGNQADKYYPTRFALKVQDDTYYRIRATVTTLDPSKDATVSLYTERKHPLYTEKTITAGTTYTTEFSIRVTPIYYEKSTPSGIIADEMVTVGVLGENSALASVEIQQVETIPTLWVLGDSTVTDGPGALPFFPLQNFTGVGSGITKYLRRDWAIVNEAEKGLTAADNLHFNMVVDRIKAGDYMYVEYGHNHKEDGPSGYKACLDKYYNACYAAGAKLLIVSPVQSDNNWDGTKWVDRFGGDDNFEGAGKSYVAEKVAKGATDVAFVNLTKTSVEFVDKVTTDNGGKKEAAQFYYATPKDGTSDVSHPNDAGADNFAYCFFKAAQDITDTIQQAVVADLLTDMTDEQPIPVSQEIMAGGLGGEAWPPYTVPSSEKYPVKIDDIVFNDDGTVNHVDVTTRAAEISMDSYGAIIITIYNADGTEKGKLYAVNQVDNTGWPISLGQQTVSVFRGDTLLEEGDTYSAVVVEADADVQPIDGGAVYSAVYKPTDIAEQLLINERNEEQYENFDYYGAKYNGMSTDYIGFNDNGWSYIGSSTRTTYFNAAGDTKYVTFTSDGAGSYHPVKTLAKEIGTSGRYMFSADLQWISGEGMTFKLVTGHDNNHRGGTEGLVLFTIGKDGKITSNGKDVGTISSSSFTNVQYILDIDRGIATVSVGGNEVGASAPVEIPLEGYQTTSLNPTPSKLTQILIGEDRKAFEVSVANLMVAKLKDKELPEYNLSVDSNKAEGGAVKASVGAPTGVEFEYNDGNAVVTADKSDAKATVIEAKYDNGILANVKATPLTFTDALVKSVPVTEGSKLMLWDSLAGMKPLAPAITADADASVVTDITASLNTVVTAKAVANDGYVFMGWLDENGNTVSTDAVYSFRLRDDTNLTADFVKEAGVDDIASFELSGDKTSVKGVAGATVNIDIINAKDGDGVPVLSVTNSDAEWSCDEPGVNVVDGVVTFDNDFDMGTDETKTVTIKAEINGIEKTYNIVANIYDYYQDFSVGDIAKTDWFVNTDGNGSAKIENGQLKTNATSANNKTYVGVHFAEQAAVTNKNITIKFDYNTSATSTSTNYRSHIFLSNLAMSDNASQGYNAPGANFQIAAEKLALEANTQYSVTIVINNKAKTAQVSAQPETGEAITLSIDNTNEPINTLFFRPGRGITDIVDNFSVTISDAE